MEGFGFFEVAKEEAESEETDDEGEKVGGEEDAKVGGEVGAAGIAEEKFEADGAHDGDGGKEGIFGGGFGIEPDEAAGDDGGAGAGSAWDEGKNLEETNDEGTYRGEMILVLERFEVGEEVNCHHDQADDAHGGADGDDGGEEGVFGDEITEQETGETGRDGGDDEVDGEAVIAFAKNIAEDFPDATAEVDEEGEQGAEVDPFEEEMEIFGLEVEEEFDKFKMPR